MIIIHYFTLQEKKEQAWYCPREVRCLPTSLFVQVGRVPLYQARADQHGFLGQDAPKVLRRKTLR